MARSAVDSLLRACLSSWMLSTWAAVVDADAANRSLLASQLQATSDSLQARCQSVAKLMAAGKQGTITWLCLSAWLQSVWATAAEDLESQREQTQHDIEGLDMELSHKAELLDEERRRAQLRTEALQADLRQKDEVSEKDRRQ